jgi:DnaJ family protein C protein 1
MFDSPDKNPGVKGIHERFARLGVVATILRKKEGRKRYDFFYKNGVPKWRGTGYYYQRFRPGLGVGVPSCFFSRARIHVSSLAH